MFCLKMFITCKKKKTNMKEAEGENSVWDLESRRLGKEGGTLPWARSR